MEKNRQASLEISRLSNLSSEQDEILCPICNKIFMDPVACSECQNCFCSKCIEDFLEENNGACPNSCFFVLKKAPPLLLKLLNKLKIKCKNFENGCNEEINYESLAKHEIECVFSCEQCNGCKQKFLKKDIFSHENECEMSLEVCKFCYKTLKRKEMKSHEIIQCLQEKIIKNESFFKEQISMRDATIVKIQEDLQREIALREKQEEMLRTLNEKFEKIKLKLNNVEEILEKQPKKNNEEEKSEFFPKDLNKEQQPEYLSLIDIKENMTNFMKLDTTEQKEILGNLLFPKIKLYANDDILSTKVLEMLLDFSELEVEDIIEFSENEEILKEKIIVAKEELALSHSKCEKQEIFEEKMMRSEKSMKQKILLEKIAKIVDEYDLAYRIMEILVNDNEIKEGEIDELLQKEDILREKIAEAQDFIYNNKSFYLKNKSRGKDFKRSHREKPDREGFPKKKYEREEREERGKRGGRGGRGYGHGHRGWREYD